MDIEWSDRYSGTGVERPDPNTVCPGQCEGMGVVPVQSDDDDPVFAALWREAEKQAPSDDGWHFVKCPTCEGTGKR